jgi:tight adherence protein B
MIDFLLTPWGLSLASAAVVFLLVYALMMPVISAKAISNRQIKQRIRGISRTAEQMRNTLLIRRRYLEQLTPWEQRIETYLERWPIRTWLEQAGLRYPAYRLVIVMISVFWIFMLLLLIIGTPLVITLGGALAVSLGGPLLTLKIMANQRREQFEKQFPEGLGLIARMLHAGLPFTQSLRNVSEQLHGPVGEEFGIVFSELNYGIGRELVLSRLLQRVPTVAMMTFVTAVRLQSESGGNLSELLERLEMLLRQRFRFQREVKTLTANGKMAASLVSIMPFAIGGLLEMMSPGRITVMLTTTGGQIAIYGGLIWMSIGILWLRNMIKIDI